MSIKSTTGVIAVAFAAIALTGCSTTAPPASQEQQTAEVSPIRITPDQGCSVAATGQEPGAADPAAIPESLTLTCGGEPEVIGGDFANKTVNSYDAQATELSTIIVVNGEARVWHSRGGQDKDCLTIQRLDEASASHDRCDRADAPAAEHEESSNRGLLATDG